MQTSYRTHGSYGQDLPYREYVGSPHVHSIYSDGSATYRQIAAAANAAKLNFVIVTDHNIRPSGLEAYHGQSLILSGEEMHDVRRARQANHLLVYGTEAEMSPYTFGSVRSLIQAVHTRKGVCYIAHPIERRSPLRADLAAIPWSHWPPEGIHGMEIWNYMSEFKGLLWNWISAFVYGFRPDWGIRGPFSATLKLWDELLAQGYRIGALGGADAHGVPCAIGPLRRTIFPYDYLFRCVTTHILTDSPLTGDVTTDKALIYDALRAGRTWVGYDLPHTTRGFRCVIESGSAVAVPGQELRRLGAVTITITLPAPGEIHLRRDGRVIRRVTGMGMRYTTAEAGIYRVEVYRRFRGRKVGWIFASPIYAI
jgi:hypothetical protein